MNRLAARFVDRGAKKSQFTGRRELTLGGRGIVRFRTTLFFLNNRGVKVPIGTHF